MESPPPLPAKTRRAAHVPVIVSATRHSKPPAQQHVVKIRVNPVEPVPVPVSAAVLQSGTNTVRINICSDYIQGDEMRGGSPYYFYTSGQSSPSDTLDSGTCSDLDGSTPPPLPKKTAVTVTVNRVNHQRGGSLTSSGAEVESDDEISCDSLNSSELDGSTEGKHEEAAIEPVIQAESRIFPNTTVEHVTQRTSEISLTDNHKPLTQKVSSESGSSRKSVVEERTYEERKKSPEAPLLDPDSYYKFHLNENRFEPEVSSARQDDEDLFAGCKGYQEGDPATSTIRSSRGTIRGVKNRVRAGIATFLQIQSTKSNITNMEKSETDDPKDDIKVIESLLGKISLTPSIHTPSMEDMDISYLSSIAPEAQQVTARRRLSFSEFSFENEPDLVSGAINPSSLSDRLHLDDHTYHGGHSSTRVTSQDIKTKKRKQSFTKYSFENLPDLLSSNITNMEKSETDDPKDDIKVIESLLGKISLTPSIHTPSMEDMDISYLSSIAPEAQQVTARRRLSFSEFSFENEPDLVSGAINPSSLSDILHLDDHTYHGGHSSTRVTSQDIKTKKRKQSFTKYSFENLPDLLSTWQEREAGKVVVYTTTMGIVRDTYQRCLKVRQILRTHLVKFDERDAFMSRETQAEIKERMNSDQIVLPQVYIEGQYIGDAEVIERLNETGELRRILKPYKSPDACTTCQVCGGYRLLPCAVCNGSKKSVHRNHFTTELVALKCMNCDEVGLVKCYAC